MVRMLQRRKAFPLTVLPVIDLSNPVKPGNLEKHLLSGESNKRVVLEAPDGERTQHDWPLCFEERRFKPRPVTVKFTPTSVIPSGKEEPCIYPS